MSLWNNLVFFLVIRNSSNKRRTGGAALINFFVPDAALIQAGVEEGGLQRRTENCLKMPNVAVGQQR